jgi:hypothetical protein
MMPTRQLVNPNKTISGISKIEIDAAPTQLGFPQSYKPQLHNGILRYLFGRNRSIWS